MRAPQKLADLLSIQEKAGIVTEQKGLNHMEPYLVSTSFGKEKENGFRN